MICNTILDAMGNTPIIKLQRMVDANSADILVKFEGLNVGGSIKTRTAYNMILDAEKRGLINEDTVIIEPTSGNQGIGLVVSESFFHNVHFQFSAKLPFFGGISILTSVLFKKTNTVI